MKLKILGAAGALVLAGCSGFNPAPTSAPLCPSGDVNIYIAQDSTAKCRVRSTQRYVVKMPRSQGTDDALRTVCLGPWAAASFVINYGSLDYCVYQLGRLA